VQVVQELGLWDSVLGPSTRANIFCRHLPYDETAAPEEAEAGVIDYSAMLPGVPGAAGLSHPLACESLAQAAASAGAVVERGVGDVVVNAGEVRYILGDSQRRVRARLVVGADGRNSVVRRQAGIDLDGDEARTLGAGLLVDGLDGWPVDRDAYGTEGNLHFFVFPQAEGKCRLYLQYEMSEAGHFGGPDRAKRFLEAFRFKCLPDSDRFPALRPAGPCAAFPWNNTWTDTVLAPGVVLIGDAGGYNDPLIGQGLSLSLQDVAVLAPLLLDRGEWTVESLQPYADERQRRMGRARSCALLYSSLFAEFGPEPAARRALAIPRALADEELSMPVVAPFVGYHLFPDEAFSDQMRQRVLATD
jgi:2-polyprenyl-6-methoxyphenol hydroxylase-like FAD-dependent oxidoreductase